MVTPYRVTRKISLPREFSGDLKREFSCDLKMDRKMGQFRTRNTDHTLEGGHADRSFALVSRVASSGNQSLYGRMYRIGGSKPERRIASNLL